MRLVIINKCDSYVEYLRIGISIAVTDTRSKCSSSELAAPAINSIINSVVNYDAVAAVLNDLLRREARIRCNLAIV